MVEIRENYEHRAKRLLEEKINKVKSAIAPEYTVGNVVYQIASQLILADVFKSTVKFCSISCWIDDTLYINDVNKEDALPFATLLERKSFKVAIYVNEKV